MESALAAAERDGQGVPPAQLAKLRLAVEGARAVLGGVAGTSSDDPSEPARAMRTGRTPYLFQGQLSGEEPGPRPSQDTAARLEMLQSPMAQQVIQELNQRLAQHGVPDFTLKLRQGSGFRAEDERLTQADGTTQAMPPKRKCWRGWRSRCSQHLHAPTTMTQPPHRCGAFSAHPLHPAA